MTWYRTPDGAAVAISGTISAQAFSLPYPENPEGLTTRSGGIGSASISIGDSAEGPGIVVIFARNSLPQKDATLIARILNLGGLSNEDFVTFDFPKDSNGNFDLSDTGSFSLSISGESACQIEFDNQPDPAPSGYFPPPRARISQSLLIRAGTTVSASISLFGHTASASGTATSDILLPDSASASIVSGMFAKSTSNSLSFESSGGFGADSHSGSKIWSSENSGAYSISGNSLSASLSWTDPAPGVPDEHFHYVSAEISGNPARSFHIIGNVLAVDQPYPENLTATISGVSGGAPGATATKTVPVVNGAFEYRDKQRNYSALARFYWQFDTDNRGPFIVDEFQPVSVSLSGNSEAGSLESPIRARAWQWEGLSISQISQVALPCSLAADRASLVLGTLPTADVTGTEWSGVSPAGYAYARLTGAIPGGGSGQLKIGSKQWSFTLPGSSGVGSIIDLCCPSNATSSSDSKDSQWPWTTSSGPYTVTDTPLWGVSNVASTSFQFVASLPSGSSVSQITLFRKSSPKLTALPTAEWVQKYPPVSNGSDTITYTDVQRCLDCVTDGRRSLELADYTKLTTVGGMTGVTTYSFIPTSLLEAKNLMNNSGGKYPSNGFRATGGLPKPTPSGATYPPLSEFLNEELPLHYIGGAGLTWSKSQGWRQWIDKDISNPVSFPAQFVFDELSDWSGLTGNFFGLDDGSASSKAVTLAYGVVLRGQAWGVVHDASTGKRRPGRPVTVLPSYGSGKSGLQGVYHTGLPCVSGTSSSANVQPEGGAAASTAFAPRKRSRVSFRVDPICCDSIFCTDTYLFPFAPQFSDPNLLGLEEWRHFGVAEDNATNSTESGGVADAAENGEGF